MKIKNQSIFIFFAFLFSILFATHYKLIVHDPKLTYDDWLIIGPLFKVKNLSQYFNMISAGEILDLQPIRDLSHLVDIGTKSLFPIYSFHFSNLLIWFIILFFLFKVFNNVSTSTQTNLVVLGLFAFSLFTTSSVAWLSARKHLLSFLFILICTEEVTRIEKDINYRIREKKILFFYLLSILSQPINIFWPLWGFIFLRLKQYKMTNHFYSVLVAIFFILGVSANFYYFHSFLPLVGKYKFVSQSFFETVSQSFLALGRYFYLILFPVSALPTPHSKIALENLVGLFLICIFLVVLYFYSKRIPRERASFYVYLSYFFIHLIPVLYNSSIFASDTYLLNASVGVYILFILLINNKTAPLFLISAYSAFLAVENFQYANIFSNAKTLWVYSFNKEQSTEATVAVAEFMIKDKHYNDAYSLTKDGLQNEEVIPVYLNSIYLNNFLSQEKISLIKNIPLEHPSKYFFLILLAAEDSDKKLVDGYAKKFFMFERNLDWVPIQKRNLIKSFLNEVIYGDYHLNQNSNKQNYIHKAYENIIVDL